jgi:cation-transporting ATPase E
LSAYGIARYGHDLPTREVRTTSALVLIAVALWVLVLQARPFNWWKTLLVASMVGAVILILVVPAFRDFYAVQLPPAEVLGEAAIVAGVAIVLLEVGWRFSRVIGSRRNFGDVADDRPADEEELARATPSA